MKLFHISDVLSATTGRLVSSRHMDGVYEIYNFLTGDNLFTHQLPRAYHECLPWLATQFPTIMGDAPGMQLWQDGLSADCEAAKGNREKINAACAHWVEVLRIAKDLPEMLPVYELGADMHTRIDPIEELEAMVGKDRMIVINPEEE